MRVKRKYYIGAVVLLLLCSFAIMCSDFKSTDLDEDELQDSDYITGMSDKFEDTPEESTEVDEVDVIEGD